MEATLPTLSGQLTVGSLSAYIDRVNNIPMLTLEEEQALASRLKETGDIQAARKLILSHLRLVVRIARGYDGYGLAQADLIQEGNIGLMKAVKRFDPTRGVRLVSFAIHWVRSEIHEFVLKNWRIVKVATTKAQRKLFFNIRKFAKERTWFSADETQTVAEMLNVSEVEVVKMEQRLAAYDESFHVEADDEDAWRGPEAYLESPTANPETAYIEGSEGSGRVLALRTALSGLDPRAQDILSQRWLRDGEKSTLHELAKQYNISAERVRQLEKQAMQRLKARMDVAV